MYAILPRDVCHPGLVIVVFLSLYRIHLQSSSGTQVVAFVRREWDGASVWLSRGVVGSSSALRPRSSDASVSVIS